MWHYTCKASSVLTPSHGTETKRILSCKVLKLRVERQFTLLCNSPCLHLRFHGDLSWADFCAGITNSLPVISWSSRKPTAKHIRSEWIVLRKQRSTHQVPPSSSQVGYFDDHKCAFKKLSRAFSLNIQWPNKCNCLNYSIHLVHYTSTICVTEVVASWFDLRLFTVKVVAWEKVNRKIMLMPTIIETRKGTLKRIFHDRNQ